MNAPPPALSVREIGSFHVGGKMVALAGLPPRQRVSTASGPVHPIDPNGEIIVGQLYVQYVRLASPRGAYPLLLWHGGGMTGVNWETTPDGRAGWQMFFLRAGFDVFVSDAVERGRASWAPYPDIYPEPPYFRTGDFPFRSRRLVARRRDAAARPSRLALSRDAHCRVHEPIRTALGHE
jgi:hypothetical protein